MFLLILFCLLGFDRIYAKLKLTTVKRLVIDIPGTKEGIPTSQPLPILDSSILLSMHQLMSIMMSQLQPVLESFNQTLRHLSGEVDALSRDMQQLRMEQFGDGSRRTKAHSGDIEEKLEYSHLQINEMKSQLDTQKDQMERAFQIQQEVLQHNLTKLKEEMEDQISQSLDAQVIKNSQIRDTQWVSFTESFTHVFSGKSDFDYTAAKQTNDN